MKKRNLILLGICIFIFNINTVNASTKIDAALYRCVDGDTAWFTVGDEIIKARFLAIDTPESTNTIEEYGKEASKFTCDYLTNAKKIVLEYDDHSDKMDKYNRELVWVWVDEKLLQEELLKNGLAEIKYLYGDYNYTNQLRNVENEAKNNNINIWNSDTNENDNYLYLITSIILVIILVFSKGGNKIIKKKIKSMINIK